MNSQLADIMLNNLFSNITRHTPEGGNVRIQLQGKFLVMSNSAAGGSLDPGKLFQRFSKGGQSTDQYGLGLSIIRQIAEVTGITVDYHFGNSLHIFTINF
jgi:signal transduction histidine kinase